MSPSLPLGCTSMRTFSSASGGAMRMEPNTLTMSFEASSGKPKASMNGETASNRLGEGSLAKS